MKDGHGRIIDYLRISLTDRCNFRCVYCMPEEGVQQLSHFDILRIEEVEQAVRVATTIGIKSVRLTGGEPTVRKGLVDLVRNIAAMPEIEKAVRKRAECDSIDFHGVESRLERRIDAAKRVVERSAARDLVELLSVKRVER